LAKHDQYCATTNDANHSPAYRESDTFSRKGIFYFVYDNSAGINDVGIDSAGPNLPTI